MNERTLAFAKRLLLGLVLGVFGVVGCATTDSEQVASDHGKSKKIEKELRRKKVRLSARKKRGNDKRKRLNKKDADLEDYTLGEADPRILDDKDKSRYSYFGE